MTFLPIVTRELRVASRKRGTYWVRTGAALALIVLGTWIFLVMRSDPTAQRAQAIFGILTGTALVYALLSGLRDTADCLSWEKREGTMGLLFLTDLKGYDVVLGKLVANSLNAFYTVSAVLPMLAIPLLMGGVTFGEFGRTALVTVNSLFLSLSTGICMSSLSRSVQRSVSCTLLLLLTLTAVFPAAGALLTVARGPGPIDTAFLLPSPGFTYFAAWDVNYAPAKEAFWLSLGLVHALSWIFLGIASFVAPRSWQDRPAGVRRLKWSERWKLWAHGNLVERLSFRKRLLDINAFFWLSARDRLRPAYVWFVLGLLGVGWLYGLTRLHRDWLNFGVYIATGVILNVVFKAWFATEVGRQLAEDRKRGALELLLSTPLTVQDILRGQWLALQRQFLGPMVLMLMVGLIFMIQPTPEFSDSSDGADTYRFFWLGGMFMFVADLMALFWVGTWQALTARNPNRAPSASVAQILVAPGVVWAAMSMLIALTLDHRGDAPGPAFFLGLWFVLGLVADLGFGLSARQKIMMEFRLVASQRFAPRPGLWRRLFSQQ
jgi:ABC-type transport system involved in cytochrome c biogenesis permease component